MDKSIQKNKNTGAILIEILVAMSILVIISSMVASSGVTMLSDGLDSEKRLQASALAEEGLEAARSIRDYQWDAVIAGTHGLKNENGYWELTDTPEVIGTFTREISITDVDANNKDVSTTVRWTQKSLQLSSRLTRWK